MKARSVVSNANCFISQKGSDSEEDDMEEDGSFEASPPPREKTTGRRAASKVRILIERNIFEIFNNFFFTSQIQIANQLRSPVER